MKKMLFLFIVISSLLTSAQAGAQQRKYYYYPASNVYYDVSGKQYVYLDNGAWIHVATLPDNYKVVNTRRVIVYHPNREVWAGNSDHVKKYKVVKLNPGKKKGHKKH